MALTRARDVAKIALTRYPRLYEATRRPYALGRFVLRQPHDPDYAVFGLFPRGTGVFLDVGANAGMSALSFRIYNRHLPIVSIEPNPFHEADLRFVSRLAKPHTYRLWAAGESVGTLDLYVPIYRGVPLTTEASLIRTEVTESPYLRRRLGAGMDGPDFAVEACSVPVRPLDEMQLRAAFVKLDVQGAELAALRGLTQTLQQSRPVVLLETPREPEVLLLTRYGYSGYHYDRSRHLLMPGLGHSSNTVFVHDADPHLSIVRHAA